MEVDPVLDLLRRHFEKVNQCLEINKNFDILTRFSCRSTPKQAIDNAEILTDEEYMNPESEFEQRKHKDVITHMLPFPNTSLEEDESDIIQRVTNFEGETANKCFSESCISSTFSLVENLKHNRPNREEVSPSTKILRKPLLERPETPISESYDVDEGEFYSEMSEPKTISRSRKFVHAVGRPPLTDEGNSSDVRAAHSRSECDGEEEVEITPETDNSSLSCNTSAPRENEGNFETEIERYKKDIKLEKAIKSLSTNDTIPYQRPPSKITSPASNYASYLKAARRDLQNTEEDLISFSRRASPHHELGFVLEGPKMEKYNNGQQSEYLKNIFEDSNSNVCQRSSEDMGSFNFDSFKPSRCEDLQDSKQIVADDKMLESILEKFFQSQLVSENLNISRTPTLKEEDLKSTCSEGVKQASAEMNFATGNYILMNHMEIQKEMTKRIEDMYKAGDGN